MATKSIVGASGRCLLVVSVALFGLAACGKQGAANTSAPLATADSKDDPGKKCFFVVGALSDVDAELFSASGAGDVRRVQQAIDAGANANAADSLQRTPLFASAFCNQAQAAGLLLDKGGSVDARDFTGMASLHAAIIAGSRDVASLLMARGANVNLQSNSGRTPLHLAAATDQPALVALLLDRGVNARLRDQNGLTAASLAANNGNAKVAATIKGWLGKQQAVTRK